MNDQAGHFGVASREVRLSYDGLEFLRAIRDGVLPMPPICETLGYTLLEVDPARVVFGGTPGHRHYHPGGFVHAGFAATLLDSAMACAVITTLAKGEMSATLEFKINLVRMLTAETGPVRAEGRVVHRGRTVATADAELRDEASKLLAHANTTCMVFPAEE